MCASPAQTKLVNERKAKGLCIDCGAPGKPKANKKPAVRCWHCSDRSVLSRKVAKIKGLCTMCRAEVSRVDRTTCASCAKKAQASHEKYLANLRKKTCNAIPPIVDSSHG
jgi:DNA-directed RNA polymerase subunit RPC12/RpoP